MLKRDALDKLLEKLDEEYATQILQLEELKEMVGEVYNAKAKKRLETLAKLREKILEEFIDEETQNVINPDIEEACSFIENEAIPDPEEIVATLQDPLDEELEKLRAELESLKEIRKTTPKDAFYLVEDNEDEDEDEESEDDDDDDDDDGSTDRG